MVSKLAVLGSPIAHSKSPIIHMAAYRVLGLDWRYDRIEARKGSLKPLLDDQDEDSLGFSVTMPLKEEAFRVSEAVDEPSRLTGAVNTLLRTPTGWAGFNTDVFGIIQAIEAARLREIKKVLIIGSGATANSALVALKSFAPDANIQVHARNSATRESLVSFAKSLGFKVKVAGRIDQSAKRVDLTISTLPAHSLDSLADELLAKRSWQPKGALFDVAYQPWPSTISKLWLRDYKPVVSGIEMLYWQAIAQIRIFTSGSPQNPLVQEAAVLEAMRHAIETISENEAL